ncbi:MAG: hypothetical protein ACR2HG_07665 [Pyrinomonadaceae bacterium]
MSEIQSSKYKSVSADSEELNFVDGELLEIPEVEELETEKQTLIKPKAKNQKSKAKNQTSYLQYIFLPLIFLTVALLGGLRLNAADGAFIFLKPALVCLIYASVLLVLFFRAGLLKLEGWFSERFSTLKNIANAVVLLTLFAASTQIFNSLLPERGLPFWVVAFCFFWTLWNNLFVEFQGKRLLQSLGSVFGLAFVAKYLLLAYLTAPTGDSWWRGILENPTQEAFTWLLDLPRFSAGTGYIQFFAVIFYLLGLFLLPPVSVKNETRLSGKI